MLCSRYACTIPDEDSVVITGGYWTRTKVERYNKDGWVKNLPDLAVKRRSHGCAGFMKDDKLVSYLALPHFVTEIQ